MERDRDRERNMKIFMALNKAPLSQHYLIPLFNVCEPLQIAFAMDVKRLSKIKVFKNRLPNVKERAPVRHFCEFEDVKVPRVPVSQHFGN